MVLEEKMPISAKIEFREIKIVSLSTFYTPVLNKPLKLRYEHPIFPVKMCMHMHF